MFVDFTDAACQVLVRAQDESRALGHGSVEGEHVLLGLFSDQGGIAARALAGMGITIEAVRELVRERLESAFAALPEWPRPLSLGAKMLLENASRAAWTIPTARGDRGEALIGPEHLLLAVSRLSESGPHQILCSLNADPNVIRFEVKKLVRQRGDHEPGEGSELRIIDAVALSAESEFAQPLLDYLGDPVAQRLLAASAQIAFDERRARFGLRDLLRALARDKDASGLLAGLGVNIGVLRERLDGESHAAD